MTKTKIPTTTTLAALLLAVATLVPACEILNPNPCDPNEEPCVFTGNNPDGLAPLN